MRIKDCIAWLWNASRGNHLHILCVGVTGMVRVAVSLFFIWVCKGLIDNVTGQSEGWSLGVLVAMMIVSMAVRPLLSLNEKLVVVALLLLPVALAVVAMIGENRRLREVEAMKDRPVRYYEYAIRPVDTVLNHPVGLRGRSLIEDDRRGNGVVLNLGGKKIVTGLSSEEILEQLDLDYQDVYDYYGGAEELW